MKNHAPGEDWAPIEAKPRRDARYHRLSLAAPLLGVLASSMILLVTGGWNALAGWPDMSRHDSWRATLALVTLALFCLGGFVLAGVAIARREKPMGLSVLALILNAPLPLLFLLTGLHFLGAWWRFG